MSTPYTEFMRQVEMRQSAGGAASGNPVGQGRGLDGHEHVWAYGREMRPVSWGIVDLDVRTCEMPGCGLIQRKTHGESFFSKQERDETMALRADPLRGVTTMADGTEIKATGAATVESFGGIVAFDPQRELVQLGDGGELSLKALIESNTGIPASLLRERLENLPKDFFAPQALAKRQLDIAEREEQERQRYVQRQKFMIAMTEASPQVQQAFMALKYRMDRMGETIQTFSGELSDLMNTDDALTLILETIRNAGSPEATRELASTWLTRVTIEISNITRDLDQEDE